MVAKRITVAAVLLLAVLLGRVETSWAEDLSNWIKPHGFFTPHLRQGQYAFQAGVLLQGNSSTFRFLSPLYDSRYQLHNTRDIWSVRSAATWALTNSWAVMSDVTFTPKQDGTDQSDFSISEHDISRSLERIDHELGTSLTVTYKPSTMLEVFATGSYQRSLSTASPPRDHESEDTRSQYYFLFLGFNMAR